MKTTKPGPLRRAYELAALFALLNMVAVGGLLTYLVGTGAVDGEKIRKVAAVLRGDQPAQTDAIPGEPAKPPPVAPAKTASSADAGAESEVEVEIVHREAERIKAELEQRLALNNSILLKVRTEREAFQKEREAAMGREKASSEVRRDDGFRKQVEILESLSPKIAVQHFLALEDVDEAAKMLLEMDTGRAKKIIEAAKRPEELKQMKLILQRVREAAPARSSQLASREEMP